MSMLRFLFFLLLALSARTATAQSTYHTINTTTDKARTAFEKGQQRKLEGAFAIAQGYFEQALKSDSLFFEARQNLADVLRLQGNLPAAEKEYEYVLKLNPAFDALNFFLVADVEYKQDKFREAAAHWNAYTAANPNDPKRLAEAKRLALQAVFVDSAMQHPVPFQPVNLGKGINTADDEYLPSLTIDGQTMVFTRRTDLKSGEMLLVSDENFFMSQWADSAWQKATPLEGVNTYNNEGAEAISPDGTYLVFTACNRRDDGSQGKCDLYWSQLKTAGWSTPVPFSKAINSPATERQPTISADGRTIVFSSDRPGGLGADDIWSTTRQPDGKWTTPVNLGPNVNTPGVEQTPFLHPDGQTLYFSSYGHIGMGQNDLYFSRRQPDGAWGPAQNLGYPINTKEEEAALVVSLDGKKGYLSATFPGGMGKYDIYQFDLPAEARPKAATYAKVRVTDANTGKLLSAKVEVIDLQTAAVAFSANTRRDGTALVCLPAGKDYALNANKKGYFFHSENFNLVDSASFEKPFLLNVALRPIPSDSLPSTAPGAPIVLRNVFFETGSATLLPASKDELDRLSALLREHTSLRIQLNGHTDNVGEDQTNQSLSEARAKSVYEYLAGQGIDARRLRYKGFGEKKPVASNDTAAGKAQNRRTEFELW